MIKHRMMNLGG